MIVKGIELLVKLDNGENLPEIILIENDLEEKFIIIEKYREVGVRGWCYNLNLCKGNIKNGTHEYVGMLKASDLLKYKFVIPEKEEEINIKEKDEEDEIDISRIVKLPEYGLKDLDKYDDRDVGLNRHVINILIKAVKQLNKQMKVGDKDE